MNFAEVGMLFSAPPKFAQRSLPPARKSWWSGTGGRAQKAYPSRKILDTQGLEI